MNLTVTRCFLLGAHQLIHTTVCRGGGAAIIMLKTLDANTQDLVPMTRCPRFVHSYPTQRQKQSWTTQHIYLSSRQGLLFHTLSNQLCTLCSIYIYIKTKIMPASDNAV